MAAATIMNSSGIPSARRAVSVVFQATGRSEVVTSRMKAGQQKPSTNTAPAAKRRPVGGRTAAVEASLFILLSPCAPSPAPHVLVRDGHRVLDTA
jgi:hypothetical protein